MTEQGPDKGKEAMRVVKLSLFFAVFALVVTLVVFFGLSRNMTGLATALHSQEMQIESLADRVHQLERETAGNDAVEQ